MEHPGKEAPLCSPNGKIKNKCAVVAALARQTNRHTPQSKEILLNE
jgi:two-component sensor histidine kinase